MTQKQSTPKFRTNFTTYPFTFFPILHSNTRITLTINRTKHEHTFLASPKHNQTNITINCNRPIHSTKMFIWTTTWQGKCYVKKIDINDERRQAWLNSKQDLDDRCAWIMRNKKTWKTKRFNEEIQEWLNRGNHFNQQFGPDNVPIDIRHATHEAQAILQIPPTNFGIDARAYYLINGTLQPII